MTTVSTTEPALTDLVAAARQVIGLRADWTHTANLVPTGSGSPAKA